MRSNWSVTHDSLCYSGTSFLGYVMPRSINGMIYGVKFYNGDGADTPKSSPILYYDTFDKAVAVVERFFDLEYKLQHRLFEDLTNPVVGCIKKEKELTSILEG